MQQYDLHLNAGKPAIGRHVASGAKLPDFAVSKEWLFGGTAAADLLLPSAIEGAAGDGHAFRDMDRDLRRAWSP